ncbi:MAG: CHASE domain-containing protein [Alphaproteobacteria bacterium]|nr:CHASE domain-containing protein [Alphaproteobacteria bacterium]
MRRGELAQDKPMWFRRIGGRTILTANIGAALSIAFFLVVSHWTQKEASQSFSKIAQFTINELEMEIGSNIHLVHTLRAYAEVSEFLDRENFSTFAASLIDDHQGIQALEWIPRVPHVTRDQFETSARRDGVSNFKIKRKDDTGGMISSPSSSEYFPVYFVEPVAGNEVAIGFDLGSNPARRAALAKARDSGNPTITEPIVLVQESEKQFGFLLFQPIYNKAVATMRERREELRGFMVGVFRMTDLMSSITGVEHGATDNIRVLIFDESAPPVAQLLFPRSGAFATRQDVTLSRCLDKRMLFGGRQWLITICDTTFGEGFLTNSLPWMVLAFGVLATFSAASYAELKNRQSLETQNFLLSLRAGQETLKNAQRIARIGNWEWDIPEGIVHWSDEVYRIFGRDPATFLPTIKEFVRSISPEERETVKQAYLDSVSGRTTFIVDHRILLPDGSEKSVREQGEIEFDANGRPFRLHGTVQDFTALRAAEARLLEVYKMEAVAQLTGGVAHEFNNIFAVIIGYLEILQEELSDDRAFLNFIKPSIDAAHRGAGLNRQLLSFARQQVLSPKIVDANALETLIETDIAPVMGAGVAVKVIPTQDFWSVRADPTSLGAALVNIASNARDAMPDGGVFSVELKNIGIEKRDDETVGAAEWDLEPGDYGVIVLTDTGVGMSPELASKAFQPFFSTSDEVTGRGLGLSMVQGFAIQSGGGVRITSELGVGTVVSLYLPAADIELVDTTAQDGQENLRFKSSSEAVSALPDA